MEIERPSCPIARILNNTIKRLPLSNKSASVSTDQLDSLVSKMNKITLHSPSRPVTHFTWSVI